MGCETLIEDAIMADPGMLGLNDSLTIRNVRVDKYCGRIDLMLFPKNSPYQLVLVEAKCSDAPDSASKVMGQLLMYYSGARNLGKAGIELLKEFAMRCPSEALSTNWISAQKVCGGRIGKEEAWKKLQQGPKITREEIGLYIAIDGEARKSLAQVLSLLYQDYQLKIGLIRIEKGKIIEVK